MKTSPMTYWFACPPLPKKPAAMPDDGLPELVSWPADVIVPAALTATTAGLPLMKLSWKRLTRAAASAVVFRFGFESLTALMPLLPDVIVLPVDVVMAMLPEPRLV